MNEKWSELFSVFQSYPWLGLLCIVISFSLIPDISLASNENWLTPQSGGVVWHVDGSHGSNDNDGHSQDSALATIQKAIDLANHGDMIIVYPGTYQENLNIAGKNIILRSLDPMDPVIVKSTRIGTDAIDGGQEVLIRFQGTEDPNCVLAGFDINGSVNGFRDMSGYLITSSRATISHCLFQGNCALGSSHVIEYWSGTIRHCLIVDNRLCYCACPGNALFGFAGRIENCTIANNISAIDVPYYAQVVIMNSIIDPGVIDIGRESHVDISYSNIHGNWIAHEEGGSCSFGPGVIDCDPNFVSPGYDIIKENGWPYPVIGEDYHLKSTAGHRNSSQGQWIEDDITSPCIDAGNPGSEVGNEPQPNGNRINMGAYGGTPAASKSPLHWRPLSDLDNVPGVGIQDFAIFAQYWLQTGQDHPADLDRNGIVNLSDLSNFLLDWLDSGF
jgi:hypothetical protein